MIWCVIIFSLFADLNLANHEDTVHTSMYTPLILFNNKNILFAPSPVLCSVAKGGNFTVTCALISHLFTCKHKHFMKSVSLLFLITLLLLSGDVERNPGPVDSKQLHVRLFSLKN